MINNFLWSFISSISSKSFVEGRLVGYLVSQRASYSAQLTFRFNIARIALPRADEYCAGIGGILPDLTSVMSSA